jgi:hypothetical protein
MKAYVIILTLLHRKHGIYSSSILFIFWLLLTIGATFNYRTILIIIHRDVILKLFVNINILNEIKLNI